MAFPNRRTHLLKILHLHDRTGLAALEFSKYIRPAIYPAERDGLIRHDPSTGRWHITPAGLAVLKARRATDTTA